MSSLIKSVTGYVAAPPEPFLVTHRTLERVQGLIDAVPLDQYILNVGAGSTNYGPRVINIDIFDSGTTTVIGSALELPFPDNSVDLVIMQGVLEHVRDADKTLKECVRVLKGGGIFYTEMPFMQPFHESPVDFRRCTLPGLSEMCLPLEHIDSGLHIGPASTLTWILRELLAGAISGGNPRLYPRLNSLIGWVVFPIKYFDYWLENKAYLHRIGSSFYYIGKK